MHGYRKLLPPGVTWKSVQDDCYKVVVDQEVLAKLADSSPAISCDTVHVALSTKYSRRWVELAITALIHRQRLYSGFGMAGLRSDKTESIRRAEAQKKLAEMTKQRRRW